MKKAVGIFSVFSFMLMCLTGCGNVGEKTMTLSAVYLAAAIISFILLICYCFFIKKKNIWFILLFSSIFIVNAGYLSLSVSQSIHEALLANRISYLGSVFLPLSMLIIILDVCNIKYTKTSLALLITASVCVFAVTATPGYLDIYYKSVSLAVSNGITVLDKVYGDWHVLYLFYLLFYFSSMLFSIIYATIKGKTDSNKHAIILLFAVLVNLGVWFVEQLVKIDFEFLSLSYIISELFLFSLYLMLQDSDRSSLKKAVPDPVSEEIQEKEKVIAEQKELLAKNDEEFSLKCQHFSQQLVTLTATEAEVYRCHISGMKTAEILEALNIKENTLKYHNKNIYGKLGVSSKKELVNIAEAALKKGQ